MPPRFKRAFSLSVGDLSPGTSKKSRPFLATQNRFAALDSNQSLSDGPNAAPPPIIVTNKDSAIEDELKKLKIKYKLKIISIGIKVFAENEGDKLKIEKLFSEKSIEYFSHPTKSQKSFKILMGNMPNISTTEIMNHLKTQNNVAPKQITALTQNKQSQLYLLSFNKGDVTKADILKIKTVCNHIVKWIGYRPRHRGPTQCYKCGMYGHGASFCHRNTTCLQCGQNHETKECTLGTGASSSRAEIVFKCVNCMARNLSSNHRADDLNCPLRQNYLEVKRSMNSGKNKKNFTSENTSRRLVPDNQQTKWQPDNRSTFADVLKANMATDQRQRSDDSSANETNVKTNLWSAAEISNILLNSIEELSKCKSKLDQLKIISSLLRDACV